MNKSDTKVALVTGAYRGLGLQTARELARLGYRVILTARSLDKAKAAAAELKAEGLAADPQRLDVTSEADIAALFASIEKQYGRLDVLVNNAAIFTRGESAVDKVAMGDVRDSLEANSIAALRLAQAALPLMRRQKYGRIVNVSSGMGQLSHMAADNFPYRISKTALNAVSFALADAVKKDGDIKVNAVCPGWVRTEMGGPDAHRSLEEGAKGIVDLCVLGPDGPSGGYFRDMNPLEL